MEEKFYKSVLENSPIGYAYHEIVLDKKGEPVDYIFLEVNSTFTKFTGLKKEEITGKRVTQVIAGIEKDSINWIGEYGEVALKGIEKEFDGYSNALKQHYRIKAYCPKKGYFITIFSNVDKEKNLEDEILEFFEISPYEIYKFDKTGKIISVNSKAGRNSGYTKNEVLNMNMKDFLISEERVKKFENEVLNTGKKREFHWEYPYKTKGGEIRHGRCTIVRQDDGNFTAFTNDVTDFYMSKMEEENARQQYKKLYDNLNSGCAVYRVENNGESGKDYIIEDFNKKSLEIENKTIEEVVGKSLYDIRPKIDEYGLIDIFREVWETGKEVSFPSKIYVDENYQNYYENHVFKLSDNKIVALYDDVTDFMLAQQELKLKSSMLENYIQKAPYGIFVIDKNGKYKDANLEAQKMSGYTREELLDMGAYSHESKDNILPLSEIIEDAKTRDTIDIERYYIKKDGTKMLWHVRGVILDEDNSLGFVKDITQERESQRKLEESEKESRALFDNAGVGIGYYNVEGRAKLFNNLSAKSMGGKPEDFEGKTIYELFPKEDAQVYMQRLTLALSSKEPKEYEDIDITPNGKKWFTSTYNSIHNSRNELLGVEVTVKDITEIKKSEEALRISEERFRNMIEASGAIMLLIDPQTTKIDHANPAACKFYGWSLEEMLGKKIYEINIASRKEVDKRIRTVVESGNSRFSFKHKLRNEQVRDGCSRFYTY